MELLVPQAQLGQLVPKDLQDHLAIGETEDQQGQQDLQDPWVHQVHLDQVVI
jgi:hypothetical protein